MRNYQELLRLASATGTFDDYVGDGFSVPWQVALPFSLPVGLGMWAYKAYLDALYFPCSKLHDWAYTPYGALIQITREEADLALYDCIAAHPRGAIDAWIVYRAVRAGGGPYFGHSTTGYSGQQSPRNASNMPLAGPVPLDP